MFARFSKKNTKRVFLDYASATPMCIEVREAMDEYRSSHFANPSALYREARESHEHMTNARAEAARVLNCAKEQIIFTSGGTEGNSIAILGVFEAARKKGIEQPHVISVLTEHPSVREVVDEIVRRGGEVTLLAPNEDGLISPEQVHGALQENTVLVSVMYVNNEIGVVQPIREIAKAVKRKTTDLGQKIFFHTDACQAPLYYSLDVSTLGVDLLTLDGLKIYGPAGTGLLYIRHGTEISPIIFGGGQENGLRSGTENVAGMIGLARALTLAKAEHKELSERTQKLRDYFGDEILKVFPRAKLNGSKKYRSPNNVNICFPNLDAEYLLVALDTYGVSASYSSSCRTLKEDSSSYVVASLGASDCALSSIRFTLGRETIKGDLDFALDALEKAIRQVLQAAS